MSRHTNKVMSCDYAQDHEGYSKGMLGWTEPSSHEHEGKGMGFGLNGGMIGTVQWQDTGGLGGENNEGKSVAETVIDAAAALTRNMF